MREFTMPKVALGDNEEMLLVSWLIEEGTEFAEGDALLEVETDKARMEVEAPDAGVLALKLSEPGATAVPGTPVAVLADVGEAYDVGEVRRQWQSTGTSRPPETVAPIAEVAASSIRESDGFAGLRLPTDVVAFAESGAFYGIPARPRRPSPDRGRRQAAVAEEEPVREPLSRHRRALAQLMTASAAIPQFSVQRDLPMREVLHLVDGLRRNGIPATVTDVLLRTTAIALRRHPEINGWFTDDAVQRFAEPAISLAADSPTGVIAPVVRGADRMSWRELAAERKRLVDGARRGRLLPGNMRGGTFALSNVGALGGDVVIPMVVPPQLAILGVGRIKPTWGEAVATAAVVADHRVLDGADTARFLATLADIVAHTEALQSISAEASSDA